MTNLNRSMLLFALGALGALGTSGCGDEGRTVLNPSSGGSSGTPTAGAAGMPLGQSGSPMMPSAGSGGMPGMNPMAPVDAGAEPDAASTNSPPDAAVRVFADAGGDAGAQLNPETVCTAYCASRDAFIQGGSAGDCSSNDDSGCFGECMFTTNLVPPCSDTATSMHDCFANAAAYECVDSGSSFDVQVQAGTCSGEQAAYGACLSNPPS